jgi:hypothetical protein
LVDDLGLVKRYSLLRKCLGAVEFTPAEHCLSAAVILSTLASRDTAARFGMLWHGYMSCAPYLDVERILH